MCFDVYVYVCVFISPCQLLLVILNVFGKVALYLIGFVAVLNQHLLSTVHKYRVHADFTESVIFSLLAALLHWVFCADLVYGGFFCLVVCLLQFLLLSTFNKKKNKLQKMGRY
jgi:hypothetical protein